MNKGSAFAIIGVGFLIIFAFLYFFVMHSAAPSSTSHMILISPLFKNNDPIPSVFTCDGNNTNPQLEISGVPENAKSLALIMHDPDAPVPGGFLHWIAWNIDPKTTVIKEGSKPGSTAIEGKNGRGNVGYTGPCPPSGTHHYHFKLYALDTMLSSNDLNLESLESEITSHVIEKTELIGTYERQK